MRVTHRSVLLIAVSVALFAGFIILDKRGVRFFILDPAFIALELAAVGLIYRITSPRVLGYYGLLMTLGIAFGSGLTLVGFLLLDHLPTWGDWLLALLAFGRGVYLVEQYRRRKRRRHTS